MNKFYTFKVKGNGHFPVDMLRYDCAWPYEANDAAHIALDRMGAGRDDWLKVREVTLVSYRKPTPERWQSFSWSCSAPKSL